MIFNACIFSVIILLNTIKSQMHEKIRFNSFTDGIWAFSQASIFQNEDLLPIDFSINFP